MCIAHLSTKIFLTGVNVKDALSSVLQLLWQRLHKRWVLGRLIGRNTYEPEFMLAEAWSRF